MIERRNLNLMLVLAIIILVATAACGPKGPKPTPTPPRGGSFTEATTADAVSFHPYLTTDTASSSYQGMVYASGLMRRDPETLELIPNMAQEWTVSDDYLTFTFTLRDDLKWSDGEPLTSADFKFTFDEMMDPANDFPYRELLGFIVSYEAPDEHTVVITVDEALCTALEGVDAVQPLPKHIWENLDWKDPETNPEIMHPSVASGPFKLKGWVKDDHVIFEANDSYFRGRPHLDSYTIRIVPEQEIAFTMLKNGEVDTADITPDNYQEAVDHLDITVYEWWLARGSWSYIGFNLRRPHLQDVQVRQALSYALNKQQIIDKVMHGLAQRIYSVYVPTSWVYSPDVPHYDYDPEEARELLKEAGYEPGPEGILVKNGEPLKLRLLFGPHTSKVREQIATITQAQFKDVGVEVEIQGMEWGAFLEATSSEPFDWDMIVGGWWATLDPHWMLQIWSEEFIPDLNFGAYVNKEVEDLFAQGGKPPCDKESRKKVYDEIQRILAEDAPYIFLFQSKSYAGVNKRIGGIVPTTLGIGYNLEEWYVKPEEP